MVRTWPSTTCIPESRIARVSSGLSSWALSFVSIEALEVIVQGHEAGNICVEILKCSLAFAQVADTSRYFCLSLNEATALVVMNIYRDY